MSRRILVLDDAATRRIVLKVKLGAAAYEMAPASDLREAQRHVARAAPHLAIVAAEAGGGRGIEWARRLRAHPAGADLPIIVTVPDASGRMDALRAGADDVLVAPVDEALLLARIRSLLRAREATEELRLRDGTRRILGLAEPMGGFLPRGRLSVVAPRPGAARPLADEMGAATGDAVTLLAPDAALASSASAGAPDVFVLLADPPIAALGLLPQIRAHPASRDAAVLVLAPRGDVDAAVMALDLGAGDVAEIGADSEEIALRVRALRRWKDGRDRLRRGVREGLDAALTDPLTGLYNRRYAMPHLERVAANAAARRRTYAVLVADLDRFKRVNDTHGHAAGDAILVELARRLSANLRDADMLARLGGEEFLIVMPGVSLGQATAAAERLCALVRDAPFELPSGGTMPLTMSMGLSIGGGHGFGTGPAALEAADRALYDAKEAGRARVEVGRTAA